MKSWLSIVVAVPLALAGCQERDVGERPTAQPVDPITQGEYSQTYESEREDDPLAQSRYGEPMDWQAEREGEQLDEQPATGETAFDEQTGQETAQPGLTETETGTGDQLSATEQPAAETETETEAVEVEPVVEEQDDEQLGQEETEEAIGEQAMNEPAEQETTPGQPVELVYEEATIITPVGAFDEGEEPEFAAETEETPPGATQVQPGQQVNQPQQVHQDQQATQAADQAKVAQLEQRIQQLETQLQELKTQQAEQKLDQQLQARVQQLENKVNTLAQKDQGTTSQQSIAVMTAKVLEDIARELRSGERFQAEREDTGNLNQQQDKAQEPTEQKGHERRPSDETLEQSPEEPQLNEDLHQGDELMPVDPTMDKPHETEGDY